MSSPERREPSPDSRPDRPPARAGRADADRPADPDARAEPAAVDDADGAPGLPPDDAPEAWDAHDPRRRKDCFAPPSEACECHCLHCGRTFGSDGIWFQRVVNDPQGFEGFWMCPTPNCSGAGFTFDIFPTDPTHPANEGWHYDDEDDDESAAAPDDEGDEFATDFQAADAPEDGEYDPDEPRYKELDEIFGPEDDDDLEGEEWKYGLQPGERPAGDPFADDARPAWEDERRRYDEPDQRPRTLDWSDREDRQAGPGSFADDDIPF